MSTDEYDRAEKAFGADMRMAEQLSRVLNPELLFSKPEPPKARVIPLRNTPMHAGDDTINAAWRELQAQRTAEHEAWLESLTEQERAEWYRSEKARRALLEAGID